MTDEERYQEHLRAIGGAPDTPEMRHAWEAEDIRNRGGGGGGGSWQDNFQRSRDEWEDATRRSGEWDRWGVEEREREFARHAQGLGYGTQRDLEDYLAGKPPALEKGTYDDLMGRIADARAAREGGFYQARPGDTLSSIANRFGLDTEDLLKWNPRPDRNLLRVGEVITIPAYKEAKRPPQRPTMVTEAIPEPPRFSPQWLDWLRGPKTRQVREEAPIATGEARLGVPPVGGFLGAPVGGYLGAPVPVAPATSSPLPSPVTIAPAPPMTTIAGPSFDVSAEQPEWMQWFGETGRRIGDWLGEMGERRERNIEMMPEPMRMLAEDPGLLQHSWEWAGNFPISLRAIAIYGQQRIPDWNAAWRQAVEEEAVSTEHEPTFETPAIGLPGVPPLIEAAQRNVPIWGALRTPFDIVGWALGSPLRAPLREAAERAPGVVARGARGTVRAAEEMGPFAPEMGFAAGRRQRPFFGGQRPEDIWDGLARAEKERAVKAAGLDPAVAGKQWTRVTPEERTALEGLVPERAGPPEVPLPEALPEMPQLPARAPRAAQHQAAVAETQRSLTELFESMAPGEERWVSPQSRIRLRVGERETEQLITNTPILERLGFEPGSELNKWRKPLTPEAPGIELGQLPADRTSLYGSAFDADTVVIPANMNQVLRKSRTRGAIEASRTGRTSFDELPLLGSGGELPTNAKVGLIEVEVRNPVAALLEKGYTTKGSGWNDWSAASEITMADELSPALISSINESGLATAIRGKDLQVVGGRIVNFLGELGSQIGFDVTGLTRRQIAERWDKIAQIIRDSTSRPELITRWLDDAAKYDATHNPMYRSGALWRDIYQPRAGVPPVGAPKATEMVSHIQRGDDVIFAHIPEEGRLDFGAVGREGGDFAENLEWAVRGIPPGVEDIAQGAASGLTSGHDTLYMLWAAREYDSAVKGEFVDGVLNLHFDVDSVLPISNAERIERLAQTAKLLIDSGLSPDTPITIGMKVPSVMPGRPFHWVWDGVFTSDKTLGELAVRSGRVPPEAPRAGLVEEAARIPEAGVAPPTSRYWDNMPVESRAAILKALGRDEGLANSSWETIAQTEREAIIEGIARRAVSDTVAEAVSAEALRPTVGQTVRAVFNGREFEGTVGKIRTTKAGKTLAFPEGIWANGSKRGIPVEGKNVQWFGQQLDDAVEMLERKAAEAGTSLTEIPAPLAGAGGGKGGRYKGPPPPRPGGRGAPTGGTQGGLPGTAADLLFGYPGEPNQTAIGRQFGGQRTAAFLRITAEGQEGQNILAQAMEKTGQKVIRRAGDRDFNGMVFENDDLARALHGEGPVPEGYEEFYDWARAAVKAEEDRMLLVDPDFARYIEANPDYFYRAWQLPEGDKDWPAAWRRLGFGDEPGFLKERVKPSYTQMREWGFEPLSRNPVDMIVLRRIAGEERRLLLVTRQKLEAARLIMPASQAPQGWRVPRNIGTLFTGTAEQPAMAVPNQVANVLERVFHVRPSGKGWTFVKAVVDFQDSVKQYKFIGSLFQHFDMLFRAGYVASTLTGIRNLAPLKYIPLGTRLMTVRALKSSQRALKKEIMSDVALYDDFAITGPMLVEEGLNLRGDPTMLARPMLENYQAVLAQGGVPPGWGQLLKARAKSVNDFTVDWLFEGVYPESQWWALKNFVIPRLRTIHPNWTPRQIAGLAATETNKMFSTIAPFQSWFKSPEAFEVSRLILFSGELEAWTRQAASIFKGPAKRLWGEYHLGMFVFLAALANVLNYWAEGEFLPLEDYSPIKVGDKWSPWPGGIAYNTRWFAPKIAGAVGEAGRPLYLDIVGQADTVLRWMADPIDGTLSRANVFWQAARRQIEGKTFWGEELGTLQERAGALLQDIAGPIGPSNIGDILRAQNPDFPFPLPASGEPRIGTTGSWIQATGFNVRAEINAKMLDSVTNQFYSGKTWKELTRAERNRKDFAQRTAPYLMPSGDPAEYAESLVGRIDSYWEAYKTTIEDFRQRRQAIPIGQTYDESKAYQEQTKTIDALKQRLGLTDDDLFGERPPTPRGPSLLDLGRYLINLFQKQQQPVAQGQPHEEFTAQALAQSPNMLQAWLKGLPIGIPPGEVSISTKNYLIMGRPQEEFNTNEKQLFPMLSRVYSALYDAARDPNGILDYGRFLVLQQEFLRNVPDPLENRWQEWRERNKIPGDMVRDVYGEYVARHYADNEGKTSQERQQWVAQNPPPTASFIAATVLNRWGHRFTQDVNEVDHPNKWHWNDLSEALEGLNIPNIDEYFERRSAQRIKELQETGQPFYSSSGVLVKQNNLDEYLLGQQQLDEYMNWLETVWRPAAGLRSQRDSLTARIDRLYDERNALMDNPDATLEERQKAFTEAKEQIDTFKEQRELIRNRLPTYQNAPSLVVKYFFGPPDAEERERLKQLPPEVRAQMVEQEAVPRGGFGVADTNAAGLARIFETMPTTEKGASSEEISAWWDANTPRLKELGYRQEPFKEEIGRLFDTMPDFGEKPTKEQRVILSQWWDENKPRLIELGWTPKWESQVMELAREWWDERRQRGERTSDIGALATHLEGLGMGDKESLQTYMVGPGADDLEKSYIWSEYYGLQAAGKKDEASQYFQAKKSRLKELGWETTPEQDEIDQIFEEYGRRKAENKKDAYNWLESMKPRLAELGYVFKNGGTFATSEVAIPSAGAYPGDVLTTKGSEAWREEFEQVHGRPPNEIDYKDMLWSLQFLREKGRPPARVDWERNYMSQVRARTRPYSRTPEFVGGRERSLTNAQWKNVQELLGRMGTNELIGSRFNPGNMSVDARETLRRFYREHPYGARSFDDWILMAKMAYRREDQLVRA